MISGDLIIFLDTGYFKGLMDKKDVHHKDALEIQEFLNNWNETTVINTTVLVETLNRSVVQMMMWKSFTIVSILKIE